MSDCNKRDAAFARRSTFTPNFACESRHDRHRWANSCREQPRQIATRAAGGSFSNAVVWPHRQLSSAARELAIKGESAEFLVFTNWQHWCRRQASSQTENQRLYHGVHQGPLPLGQEAKCDVENLSPC